MLTLKKFNKIINKNICEHNKVNKEKITLKNTVSKEVLTYLTTLNDPLIMEENVNNLESLKIDTFSDIHIIPTLEKLL